MSDSMVEDDEDDDLTEGSQDTQQQRTTSNDMDSNISSVHNNSDKIDSQLIKKILDEMKSEFTRGTPNKVNDPVGSVDENDKINEENEDDPKPIQENFHGIKVSDIIKLDKFEVNNDEDVVTYNVENDELIKKASENKNIIEEIDNEKDNTVPQENETDKNKFENKDEIVDSKPERNETVNNLTNELDEINQESSSETKNINDSNLNNVKAKKISEKKPLLDEDLIINEPRRKRSLRNQTLIKDIDEESNTGLKRSSRRFSKEYNRESVLQNAIARKEKSFSSLGSNDERSYRRGQRSPRQSTVNNKNNNINNNSNSSSNNSNVSNNGINITNDPKIVTVKSNNNNSNNNKSNRSPKSCLTSPSNLSVIPETSSSNISSLRIIKSPQYDEKLQSTIDNLKSTLEQSSINNQKVSKLDYNHDVLSSSSSSLVTERLQQNDNSEITDELNKKENNIVVNNNENISNKDSDNKDFIIDSGTSKKPIYGKLTKKKNRYFKGLKYTFKGGHVKNSNRTWSMTRRKKFELAAKEKKVKTVGSVDEDDEEEEEEESEENENKSETDCDKSVKNFNNSDIDIHDPKRLSSIFGVDISEDVKNSDMDDTAEASASDINLPENSKTNSNSSTTIIGTDNNSSNNGKVIRISKRKLNVDTTNDKNDEINEKKKCNGSESPQIGEVAPPTQETTEVLETLTSISAESMEEDKSLKRLCLCNSKEQYYVSPSSCRAELYCQAIDSLDGRLIGCCNTVDITAARLVRASVKLPYLVLCNVHHQRIQRHNCCPGCGNFCTQGRFVQCKYGHHFHKDCCLSSQPPAFSNLPSKEDKSNNEDETDKPNAICLHCSTDSFCDVIIRLGAHKYPVFLPLQKPPKQVPSAKMTFGGCVVEPVDVRIDNSCLEDEQYLVDDDSNKPLVPSTSLVLPSGLKISSEGLPDSGLKDKLDKLLHVACTVTTPPSGRYTLRNMYQAAKSGDAEKLIYMLASGLNPNHQFREWIMGTALHAACYSGHMTIVHLLIQAGSDIDILDKEQNTPLMIAVLNLHNDIVKYLVKAGADVTFKGGDGMTALHLAAKSGNLEACHYLMSNFNVPRFFIDTVDDGRWTPLVWAAEHCHTDVVRFLLSKRADPLVRDAEQNIALHWAALAGSVEISEALLNYGSEINSTNAHGDTALHIAARQNAYSCTVLLLSRGSRVDLRNRAGYSALECCLVPDSPAYNAIKLNVELRNFSNSRRMSRILINDITRGHEVNPIQCVNAFDDEGIPQDFTYIIENCFTSNISVDRTITSLQFCKCRDNCTTGCCMCGKISIRCWYDNDGKLLPEFNFADPPMLFECNRACTCNKLTCKNRVVQHGIKARFQLFKTSTNKGWGVRTLRLIQKGSYVCEYIGEIISDCEADTREDDSYLFDLDNRDGETYCIDARKYGNIARFINHMCVPNLLPVRVFIDHQDLHFPRIAFFANRDVQANEELGFDYGEKFWIIKYKSFTCTCGAEKCRYSETSIQQTLENYQQKLQQEENTQ